MGRSKGRVQQHRRIDKAIEAGVSRALAQMNGTPYAQTRQLDPAAQLGPMGVGNLINALTTGAVPMPRNPLDMVAFGPNWALPTQPLDPSRRDTDRPEPRLNQYPVAWNIPGNGGRAIPWETLRAAADNVDIMRRCIEVRKEQMRGLKWAVTLDPDVVTAAYEADGKTGRMDIEAKLRQQYLPEIQRCTEFWAKPWRSNGVDFGQWINAYMEDYLVLDAVAVYPQVSYSGELLGLELIDGATIKPLLDYRGSRPRPPFPAFQQNLWGYPRSEFTAGTVWDEQRGEVVNPELGGDARLTADQLFYYRSNFRTTTPYGLSAVEQALISARLYLKRQGWMLAEYDDGSTPLMWLVPEATPQVMDYMTAQNRADYERSINDKLAGNTAGRHRIKLTPPGMTPIQMESTPERYKPDYDLHLITMLAGFFGVTKTGLGFSESRGLGNSGLHEGQENVQDKATTEPDRLMLEAVFNELSHGPLRMPKELRIQFIDPDTEDSAAEDATADAQRKRGTITLNEDRKRIGLAPSDIPEADALMVEGGPGGWTPLEGMIERAEATAANEQALVDQQMAAGAVDGQAVDGEDVDKSLELAAYARWRRKRGERGGRPFLCKALEPDDFPAGVPLDVNFADWAWVPDEYDSPEALTDDMIVKGFGDGNDHWKLQLRDRKGRWMKMGTHGPALPGKTVLAGLAEDAKRGRAERAAASQLRVNDASSSMGGMSAPSSKTPKLSPTQWGVLRFYADPDLMARAPREPHLYPNSGAKTRRILVEAGMLAGHHGPITEAGRAALAAKDAPNAPKLSGVDAARAELKAAEDAHAKTWGASERDKSLAAARVARAQQALADAERGAPAPKRTVAVTLADGTVETRTSTRPYTHAVTVEIDRHAHARLLEQRAASVRRGGNDTHADSIQRQADAYLAGPQFEHAALSFHASEAAANTAARKAGEIPYYRATVRQVDAPTQPTPQRPLPTPPAALGTSDDELAHLGAVESVLKDRYGDDWENVDLASDELTAYSDAVNRLSSARRAEAQSAVDPVALAVGRESSARRKLNAAADGTPEWRAARDEALAARSGVRMAKLERAKATPVREFTPEQREDAVRAAYRADQAESGGGSTTLADLRTGLHERGMSRADQDAALRSMALRQDIVLWPQENQKEIDAADRDSALHIGGEHKHIIHIDGTPSAQRQQQRTTRVGDPVEADGPVVLRPEGRDGGHPIPAPKPKAKGPKLTSEQRLHAFVLDEVVRLSALNPDNRRSADEVRASLAGSSLKDVRAHERFLQTHLTQRGVTWRTEDQQTRHAETVAANVAAAEAERARYEDRLRNAPDTRRRIRQDDGLEGQEMAEADRRGRAANGITDAQAAAHRQRFGRRDAAPEPEPKRLTSRELMELGMGNMDRERLRTTLRERGWSDSDVDTELGRLGISRERAIGEDGSIAGRLFNRGKAQQSDERQAAASKATPGAYAKLLDDRSSDAHLTHAPSRKVFEAMRANGWELAGARPGGIYEWARGDERLSTSAPSGIHAGKGQWAFHDGGRKLTYAGALEHVGGPAKTTSARDAASISSLTADMNAQMLASTSAPTAPHGSVKAGAIAPGTRLHVGGHNVEVVSGPRRAKDGGHTYTVKREGGFGEGPMTFRQGEDVPLAAPKTTPAKKAAAKMPVQRPADPGAPLTATERAGLAHREAFQAFREGRGSREAMETARREVDRLKAQDTAPAVPAQRMTAVKPKQMEADWSAHHATLSDGQRKAVRDYTTSDYFAINEALRGNQPKTAKERKAVAAATEAISSAMAPAPRDTLAYRGTHTSSLGLPKQPTVDQMRSLVGKTLVNDAFTSTSVDKGEIFAGNLELEIEVPRGTRSLYLGDAARVPTERELLLDKGARMRVDAVTESPKGSGNFKVKVRIV